jgi:hypothetical protein
MLPDDVVPVPVAGSRKRKQAFSMNDPDNVELAHLATQAASRAAKKKAKLIHSSGKDLEISTHQKKAASRKSNCQPSKNVNNSESEGGDSPNDDDDEAAIAEATKKKGLSKPTPSQSKKSIRKKLNKKTVAKQNCQPSESAEDLDMDNLDPDNDPRNDSGSNDDDEVEVVEQAAESAEEELS